MSDTTRRIDPGTGPEINYGERLWDHLLREVSSDANSAAEQFVECFDTDQQGE